MKSNAIDLLNRNLYMQEHMDMVTDSVEAVHVELRKINGLK